MAKATNGSYTELNAMHNVLHILIQISIPYSLVLSIIGICGNFLTIMILARRSISKNFNNCTLVALALTDLLFNFTLVSRCISDLTHSHREQLCRLLSFLSHFAELLSACFTAHFTAQRFIAVRFPLSVFVEKRIHLMHYLIVAFFIIFGIVYCSALVGYNSYDVCHEELDLPWFLSDALLSFLLPFTIIMVLNILIVLHLKKGFPINQQFRFGRRHPHSVELLPVNLRQKSSTSSDIPVSSKFQAKTGGNSSNHSKDSISRGQTNRDSLNMNSRVRSIDLIHRPSSVRSKSQSYRVTRMLIIVSTCFLLLNAPSHICTIALKILSIKNTIAAENFYQTIKQYNQTASTLSTNIDSISSSSEATISSATSDYEPDFKWAESLYVIVIITQHIAYASYSINFFLYSFCGMKFRRELKRYMFKHRRQTTISRSNTMQNTS